MERTFIFTMDSGALRALTDEEVAAELYRLDGYLPPMARPLVREAANRLEGAASWNPSRS
jgi:hypothetical protein